MSKRRGFVKFVVKLPISIRQEGDWYYAACPMLDVHSQGRTYDEARSNLTEALQLFIESCYQRRVLDDVLTDCGFEADNDNPNESDDGQMLEMTLPLLARQHAEARAC